MSNRSDRTYRSAPTRTDSTVVLGTKLRALLGDGARVFNSPSSLRLYSRDLADVPDWLVTALMQPRPGVVVQPRHTRDISEVMGFASREKVPVTPRGVASTAFGGPVPARGGIMLDFSFFKAIGPVDTRVSTGAAGTAAAAAAGPHATITVEAGARFGDIADRVAKDGLTLAVYPSNRMGTVGGWLSSGGFGINAAKYGSAADWVESIETVGIDGTVRQVRRQDPLFERLIGTEGQLGLISKVTLRLISRPTFRRPHLVSFESNRAALRFAAELQGKGNGDPCGVGPANGPATIMFLEPGLLRLLNQLATADGQTGQRVGLTGCGDGDRAAFLDERPSLLLLVDDAAAEEALGETLRRRPEAAEADREKSGHLWADRYFPMRIRSLGPSLLAGQVVLPLEATTGFLEEAHRLAARWGLELAVEAHALRGGEALVIPMFLTDVRKSSYTVHLAVASMLDSLGRRFGGRPYNLGVWHAAFAAEKYTGGRLADLVRAKRGSDPVAILNPGKFLSLQALSPAGRVAFRPGPFGAGMSLLRAVSPLVGAVSGGAEAPATRMAPAAPAPTAQVTQTVPAAKAAHAARFHVSPEPVTFDGDPLPELLLTSLQCTSCANCVAVCPAYLHTGDERVTARGKLWLARRLAGAAGAAGGAAGKDGIDVDEAAAAFQCMRCRACAETCQAGLPLMDAWERLETALAARFGRPSEQIQSFVAGVEKDPAYAERIGLVRPAGLLTQKWLKENATFAASAAPASPVPVSASAPTSPPASTRTAGSKEDHGGRFHLETVPVAPPPGGVSSRFRVERGDYCVNCGHCGEACIYGVHFRNPNDPRRMAAPASDLCKACFRCVMECPRQNLSISTDPAFAASGKGPFTPDILFSLARQADDGRIPVTGAGYRGPFAGEGFDGMWTDMSEIVRPTRDGIHGREYISTAIYVGRRPRRLTFDARGEMVGDIPVTVEIPIPVLFSPPPVHGGEPAVMAAARQAAARLETFVLDPAATVTTGGAVADQSHGATAPTLIEVEDAGAIEETLHRITAARAASRPIGTSGGAGSGVVVVVRVPLDTSRAPSRVVELAKAGVEAVHLAAGWDGICGDGRPLHEALPMVHQALVAANIRDDITLLAGGGIAAAEHVPKAIILGADGVVVDVPLVAALGCPLTDGCFAGDPCPSGLATMDPTWGAQRIVNLMISWRNQLLEVLGAMGMREVRRLRGERGRAMFAAKLEADLFAPLFKAGAAGADAASADAAGAGGAKD